MDNKKKTQFMAMFSYKRIEPIQQGSGSVLLLLKNRLRVRGQPGVGQKSSLFADICTEKRTQLPVYLFQAY